jgi:hypothetical protein
MLTPSQKFYSRALVNKARIILRFTVRDVRWVNLLEQEVRPLETLKEPVAFDVLNSVLEVSVPLGQVPSQQMLD